MLLERFRPGMAWPWQIGGFFLQALGLFGYYQFFFPNTDQTAMIRLLMVFSSLLISFLFIPYLPQKEHFEIYITRIITGLATTAFFTIALGLGVMAILFAVKSLLYAGMSDNLYVDTWVLAWFVFAPLHFLYELPVMEDRLETDDFNRVIRVMLLYIALPVITIYTLVLYLYFGKIVITQVWPKGIVSYLVVSYTAVGIAAIFLVAPFRRQIKWVNLFTVVFSKSIFPLLVMMFISIYMRINQFGFTENRYFILAIGIWSALIMVYLNFNKGQRLIVLPMALALICFLTVVGPWNCFAVSINSQSQRFYQIAAKYEMIQNGVVSQKNLSVSKADQQEISGVLRYFNQSHQLKDLTYLPAGFTMDKMEAVFGFPEAYPVDYGRQNYFSYYWQNGPPQIISGYDLFFLVEGLRSQPAPANLFEKMIVSPAGQIKVILDGKNQLIVQKNGLEVYRKDLQVHVVELYKKYGSSFDSGAKTGTAADLTGMVLGDDNGQVKLMIVFSSINGSVNLDTQDLTVDNLTCEIFLTVK